MPPKDPTRYDARTHLFVGGLKGAGKTEALLARASAWVGPDYEGVTFRDARPALPPEPEEPGLWGALWPEDRMPQAFSTYILRGMQDPLARGRGVPSTVEVDGEPHLVAALISSKEGHVWRSSPAIKEVAAKAHAIQGECWQALAATPRQDLPPQTARIAKGPIRVIKVPRIARQGPGWYVYLCVPIGNEGQAVDPDPEPKKRSQSRFRNLEL